MLRERQYKISDMFDSCLNFKISCYIPNQKCKKIMNESTNIVVYMTIAILANMCC